MDDTDAIEIAEQHAAAVILIKLNAANRGYTDLMVDDPLISEGLDLLHDEAVARGVDPKNIVTTGGMLVILAQELAAAGVDPKVIAAETKFIPAAPEAEADDEPQEEAKD